MSMKNWKKWVVFTLLMLWGFISIALLSGDADSVRHIALFEWFAMKFTAAISFAACYKVTKSCFRHGLLPDIVYTVKE